MRRSYSRHSYPQYREPLAPGIRIGAPLALVAVLVLLAAPTAYRLGALSLPLAADRLFVWGAYIGGVAALLSILGVVSTLFRPRGARRGLGRGALAVALGAMAFVSGGQIPLLTSRPALRDVTTDTQHPPAYVTLPKLEGTGASPKAYAGEALAVQQRQAYPDIQPLLLAMTKEEAFAKAVRAVRELGWRLVAADGPAGRIEASVSSRFFGTVEDVVVRISEAEGGSRVDVRSVSREISGGAANATRVRAILQALRPS